MNAQTGSTFFGERYSASDNLFMNQVVQPMIQMTQQLQTVAIELQNPNFWRPLESVEAFNHIPVCMQIPILLIPEVRDLHARGRIRGFGLDPEDIEGYEDVWGRVCYNGVVEDAGSQLSDAGQFNMNWNISSEDPTLTSSEMSAYRDTRFFILNTLLPDTNIDPTDGFSVRG